MRYSTALDCQRDLGQTLLPHELKPISSPAGAERHAQIREGCNDVRIRATTVGHARHHGGDRRRLPRATVRLAQCLVGQIARLCLGHHSRASSALPLRTVALHLKFAVAVSSPLDFGRARRRRPNNDPYQRWKADPSPDGPPLSPVLTPAWLGRHRLTGRGNLINAEEWSEIRGLRRAEAMGVKAIARRLGVASNTVRVMHPN